MYFITMNVQKFKHAFLNRLSGFEVFEQLMDLLPDVAFT